MKKLTAKQILEKRMDAAYKELRNVVSEKVKENSTNIFTKIGLVFGITGQTVYNYTIAKSKSANGYMIEALTEEFKKLP